MANDTNQLFRDCNNTVISSCHFSAAKLFQVAGPMADTA